MKPSERPQPLRSHPLAPQLADMARRRNVSRRSPASPPGPAAPANYRHTCTATSATTAPARPRSSPRRSPRRRPPSPPRQRLPGPHQARLTAPRCGRPSPPTAPSGGEPGGRRARGRRPTKTVGAVRASGWWESESSWGAAAAPEPECSDASHDVPGRGFHAQVGVDGSNTSGIGDQYRPVAGTCDRLDGGDVTSSSVPPPAPCDDPAGFLRTRLSPADRGGRQRSR
jgi:hypothetical protein